MQKKFAQYQAYSNANQTAPKTRQIVMLYDGAIRFLKQAKEAVEEKRIEDRFNLLNKASEVIVGLQSHLDFDHGGDVAKLLFDYYMSIDNRILAIHRSQDMVQLEAVIRDLKQMRDAWFEIDQKMETPAASPSVTASSTEQAPSMDTPIGSLEVSA